MHNKVTKIDDNKLNFSTKIVQIRTFAIYESVLKIFWDNAFVVRNSVFSTEYLAVIFRKRSHFEM